MILRWCLNPWRRVYYRVNLLQRLNFTGRSSSLLGNVVFFARSAYLLWVRVFDLILIYDWLLFDVFWIEDECILIWIEDDPILGGIENDLILMRNWRRFAFNWCLVWVAVDSILIWIEDDFTLMLSSSCMSFWTIRKYIKLYIINTRN